MCRPPPSRHRGTLAFTRRLPPSPPPLLYPMLEEEEEACRTAAAGCPPLPWTPVRPDLVHLLVGRSSHDHNVVMGSGVYPSMACGTPTIRRGVPFEHVRQERCWLWHVVLRMPASFARDLVLGFWTNVLGYRHAGDWTDLVLKPVRLDSGKMVDSSRAPVCGINTA